MNESRIEADKLRKEAKDLLNRQFLSMMRIRQDESSGFYLQIVDRIVDCIIFAAVLEVSACQLDAYHKTEEL